MLLFTHTSPSADRDYLIVRAQTLHRLHRAVSIACTRGDIENSALAASPTATQPNLTPTHQQSSSSSSSCALRVCSKYDDAILEKTRVQMSHGLPKKYSRAEHWLNSLVGAFSNFDVELRPAVRYNPAF